jgi:hypothetical protein
MSQIQNLGNGIGWIYAALPNGSNTIVCVEKNTIQGVHNMRQIGTTTAPIVANRSAVGTIQITAVPSAGDITAVTINSVNQIGANVAVTVGQVDQTATDLAAAINTFTATGYPFTAEAIGDTIYVYSAPQDGALVNGFTITISVSNVAITTTTTAFSGGSNQDGVYDSNFGYEFYLDSSPSATSSTINLSTAEDGLQSGIFTESLSVNASAQLLGITRCSAFTNILTDTNSMNPTSDLTYIDPNGFVQGDVVRLTQFDSSRVVTVYDVSNAQVFPANIYLTNADSFYCQDNKSIELRLQYDPVLGAIWIENSRSFVPGPNIVTRAEMLNLITNNQVKIGENYLVTNAAPNYTGIDGIIITGIKTDAVSTSGQALFYLPDYNNQSLTGKFVGAWNVQLTSVTISKYYSWNGLMYESLTGAVGTAPDTDAINWSLVPLTDPVYQKEVHTVQYNLSLNNIVKREDKRGNSVTGANSCQTFCWGNDKVTDNIVQGGDINIWNIDVGDVSWGKFQNNLVVNSDLSGSSSIYRQNYFRNTINYVTIGASKQDLLQVDSNNLVSTLLSFTQFQKNTQAFNIYNNSIANIDFYYTSTAPIPSGCPVFINNNTITGDSNSVVSSVGSLKIYNSFGVISALNFSNNTLQTTTEIGIYYNSSIGINVFKLNNIVGNWAGQLLFYLNQTGGAIGNTISNTTDDTTLFTASPAIFSLKRTMINEVINNIGSSYMYDVSTIVYLSGTTLTLPAPALKAGVIKLIGTGTISKILIPTGYYAPRFPIKFITDSSITFTPTLKATAVLGDIVSDGGNVTITSASVNGGADTVSDTYVVQATYALEPVNSSTIATGIWIKQYNTQIQ